ncbi:MAG: ribonuclease III [SAR324 cluster bacterium]|nr:ribonuclease III [SAR324 cluster bacterium]
MKELEKEIGYQFQDLKLLELALSHKSYANEARTKDNERLEFLGDAVLQIVISDYLFEKYPDWNEGLLSRFRAVLVCETGLEKVANRINLGRYILIGKGEEASGGRQKASILANVSEAVFAAVYLDAKDKGAKAAKKVILSLFESEVEDNEITFAYEDVKTYFQEWVQKKKLGAIEYKLVSDEGPDHMKTFVMALFIGGKEVAKGSGKNKKTAEQQAAFKALQEMKKK